MWCAGHHTGTFAGISYSIAFLFLSAGGTCSTRGRRDKYEQTFIVKTRRKNKSTDGKIILKCILKIRYDDVEWVEVAQNSVEMRTIMDTP
jgi:hypothetical protein